ncbi:MAG: sugar nucleotide-binding protein [Candidatus Nanohaloarchaea archaeon]|nr:sugar nucleotide-binding protein [Candidatus Nanohaloarchaea archaeon]
MKVAVIGGRGFVGTEVSRRLGEEHEVTTIDPKVGGEGHISADITVPGSIGEALGEEEFDAVVNLAGLTPMKEPRGVSYRELHVEGAGNVVEACEESSVERLVHMSALGADPDSTTEYLRTKGEGKERVLDSGLEVTVLEPSLVFDDGNELVELAKRFASTRAFPNVRTRVQPVYRGDVAELFRLAVEGGVEEEVLEVGGPENMTIFEFVKETYRSEGYSCYPIPLQPLMKFGLYLAEPLPFVPYGADQAKYLYLDNTVEENDAEEYVELTGVEEWLEE